MKLYRQIEASDCGIMCIKMILDQFGIYPSIQEIKKNSRYLKSGVSMLGIIECFKIYHIEAKGYEASLEDIQRNMKYPCILYCNNEGMSHYVVLWKIHHNYFYIHDPCKGKRRMTQGELAQIYLGKVVRVEVISNLEKKVDHRLSGYLFSYIKAHIKQMLLLFILTLFYTSLLFCKELFIYNLLDHYSKRSLLLFIMILISFVIIQRVYLLVCNSIEYQSQSSIMNHNYLQLFRQRRQFFLSMSREEALSKVESLEEFGEYMTSLISMMIYELFLIGFVWILIGIFDLRVLGLYLFGNGLILIMSLVELRRLSKLRVKLIHSKNRMSIFVKRIVNQLDSYRISKHSIDRKFYNSYLLEVKEVKHREIQLNNFLTLLENGLLVLILLMAIKLKGTSLSTYYLLILMNKGNDTLNTLLEFTMNYPRIEVLYERMLEFKKEEVGRISLGQITKIELEEVSFSYGYKKPVLSRINYCFQGHYLIQGKNGSGKSTLLMLLHKEYLYYLGRILIDGIELRDIVDESIDERIVYVGSDLMIELNELARMQRSEWLAQIVLRFSHLDWIDIQSWNLNELSQGKRQFVTFLYVLFQGFHVYLLDECLSHIDSSLMESVKEILTSDIVACRIILLVEHSLNSLADYEIVEI